MRAPNKQRFNLQEFNNRGGSRAWRVTGTKRDGSRVRENYRDERSAQCRKIELEAEYHALHADTDLRATKLTHEQIRLCEVAVIKLGEDWQRLLDAVDHWQKNGKQAAVVESPRIDAAVEQFKGWLDKADFRDATKSNLRLRVGMFSNSIGNLRVSDITPDTIYAYLEKRTNGERGVTVASSDNDRRALSKFFGWCQQRPRQWIRQNPARKETREKKRRSGKTPVVMSVDECKALLRAAEGFKDGRLVPYVCVCLFAGLRPFEAARLTWDQVNFKDGEIILKAEQTKTGRGRIFKIVPEVPGGGPKTLLRWLRACEGKEFFPSNWRRDFDEVKALAGFTGRKGGDEKGKPWPEDVMRHTAISHYFRLTGSYGRAAEQFGNSEAIIKAHYQSVVGLSSKDTEKFYEIKPTKKATTTKATR
jgi:integrase